MSQQEEFKIIIDSEADDALKDLDSMGGIFEGLGGIVAGFAATAGAALLTLAGIIAGKALSSSQDLERAVANLGKETGASKDEFKSFEAGIKDIYSQNWGESFEDIGQAMAEVKKQTKLSGKALNDMTKDAIILRDTFDYDVNESTRSAKMLMDQFGISSKEAFNLIAQGAQKGLDKNGDLLDTINEYSVQFKAMGFDSDQMFDTLIAGAESGAFSIDKIGDAVKEFTIRSKDGSKTTSEAFDMLGMDADKMGARFAKGGKDANKAFYEVIDALGDMKDPMKQNTVGVNLFGSMFEDLGVKGITALGDIEDGFNKATDTMGELDSMTFMGVTEFFQTFGRILEVNILVPLGQKVLPLLQAFLSWLNSKLPTAIAVFKQVASYLQSVFGPVFVNSFNIIKRRILEFIAGSGDMKSQVTPIFDALKELMKTIAVLWGQYANVIVNDILPNFLNYVKLMLPIIGAVFLGVIKALTFLYQTWSVIFSYLSPIIGVVYGYLVTAFANIINLIRGVIKIVSGLIKGDWSQVWAGAKMVLKSVMASIKTIIKTGLKIASTIFKASFALMVNIIKTYLIIMRSVVLIAFNYIKSVISKAFSFIVSAIKTRGGSIKKVISSLVSYIKSKLTALSKSAYSWGANFLKAFTNGVKAKIKALKNMALEAAKQIKNVLGFHSPTKEGPGKEANKWAPNFMDMFISGMDMRKTALASTTEDMAGMLAHISSLNSTPIRERGAGISGNVTVTGNSFIDQQMVELVMQRAIRMLRGRR